MSVFAPENPSVLGRSFSSTRRMLDMHALASQGNEQGQARAQVQVATSVPDRISAMYRRYYYADSPNHSQTCSHTSLASSRQSSSAVIELLLSRIVDALIFTSAIAITAYNYWTGSLNNSQRDTLAPITPSRQPMLDITQLRESHTYRHTSMPDVQHHLFHDTKQQRTQAWADSVAAQQYEQRKPKRASFVMRQEPSVASTSSAGKPPRRRPQSLPLPPRKTEEASEAQKKQDEMFARMEERLQNLIQEGQAALTSKVELYDVDYTDMSVRNAFASNKKHSM